jgi:hypothetical protein
VRVRPLALAFAVLLGVAVPARGEDAPPAPKPVPPLASTAVAKEAVAAFKAAFKGRDVAAKADAVDALGAVTHPFVVDELMKVARHKDPELRAAAFQNLQRQRALPDVAGKAVLALIDPKSKDVALLTDVVDVGKALGHRGALPSLVALFHHDDHAVVRAALDAVGDLKDVRALDAVLDLMKELHVDEGVKWDGAEASVDTGASGDADQKAAEAQAKGAAAANARRKSAARRMRSAGEIVYLVLKDLTGQAFLSGKDARAWVEKNKEALDARKRALDEEQKQQEAAGRAALAAARAGT